MAMASLDPESELDKLFAVCICALAAAFVAAARLLSGEPPLPLPEEELLYLTT